jgi:capsular polysaccharide biosynthesis protein
MQAELIRNLPVNFIEKDRNRFAAALKFVYDQPSVNVYKKQWWDFARGRAVKSIDLIIRSILAVLLKKKKIRHANTVVIACNQYSGNYFHWINDVLPCLIYLKSVELVYPLVIDKNLYNTEFVQSSLKIISWPVFVCERNTLLYARKIYKPGLTAGEGNQNPLYYLPLREQLLKQYNEPAQQQPVKIFITRRKATYRNILPQKDVEAIFQKNGFTIVETDQMTFEQQVHLFSKCSHLAAAHGAGLTNMTFMKKGSKVLEVRQKNDNHNNCYFAMANTVGLKYYYFFADGRPGAANVQEDDFIVDAAAFEKLISVFGAG